MSKIRRFLSSKLLMHALAVLGLLALWGYIETDNKYILLGVAASFAGAVCGEFIRVIDRIAKINGNQGYKIHLLRFAVYERDAL